MQSQSQGEKDCKAMEAFAREVEVFLENGDEWAVTDLLLKDHLGRKDAHTLMAESRKARYHNLIFNFNMVPNIRGPSCYKANTSVFKDEFLFLISTD